MTFDNLFEIATEIGRAAKETFLNVSTAGGRYKSNRSKESYDVRRRDLEISVAGYKSAKQVLESAKSKLDSECAKSMKLLGESQEIVERLSWQTISSDLPALSTFQIVSLANVDTVLSDFNATIEAGKGAGIGAMAGTGAWLLVAHLGTASTGAAIGGLSGAAATNAILAWFGGGALAAGGGGMALGGFALGGITILPAIAFGAYTSYKEAFLFDTEAEKAVGATIQNHENIEKMQELLPKVESLTIWAERQNEVFSVQIQEYRDRARQMAEEIAEIANRFAIELSAQNKTTTG